MARLKETRAIAFVHSSCELELLDEVAQSVGSEIVDVFVCSSGSRYEFVRSVESILVMNDASVVMFVLEVNADRLLFADVNSFVEACGAILLTQYGGFDNSAKYTVHSEFSSPNWRELEKPSGETSSYSLRSLGTLVGYAYAAIEGTNSLSVQKLLLNALGCVRVVEETACRGGTTRRPVLLAALRDMTDDEVLLVVSGDRLGRNLTSVVELWKSLGPTRPSIYDVKGRRVLPISTIDVDDKNN